MANCGVKRLLVVVAGATSIVSGVGPECVGVVRIEGVACRELDGGREEASAMSGENSSDKRRGIGLVPSGGWQDRHAGESWRSEW